ncbi:MAG: hemin uptake protein HemP [Pseudomonadota bacterium]
MQLDDIRTRKPETDGGPTVLDARLLLDGQRHALLRLDDQTYRLSLTRQNKLILTK